MTPAYAELHCHTSYSFLDGASQPEELMGRAVELGYQYLAITDHDGLYGAMEFAHAARNAGIAPITGAEVTLHDGSHLTLLTESAAGYSNLCRLLTAAHAPDPNGPWPAAPAARTPRLDPALLPAHAKGLVLLTGCRLGRLSRLVDAGDVAGAEALLWDYIAWFGARNVYVELQHNRVSGDTKRVRQLATLAAQAGVPAVATGNVHYHHPDRHRLQDALVAIRTRSTLDGCHRERRPNATFALQPPTAMARRFHRYPEAIRTSVALAERCAGFDLTRDLGYRLPTGREDVADPDAALAELCWRRLPERYPEYQVAASHRVWQELELIRRHRLAGFFLLYHELLDVAREVAAEVRREQDWPVSDLPVGRGRGSSVSSIVCYLIGLSPVDPLAHHLFLGRFLNEELAAVPDIDLDFPREIREWLIARVYERYPDRAGLICAFATYRLRSAVRDVGKALGIPATDLDRIAKLSEPTSAAALGTELAKLPEYAGRLQTPPWSHLIELAGQLAGFPRHVTQHSGGMVIATQPLRELVAIQPAAMARRWLLQWDKDSVADAGFVKIDFLALGMLSLVEECLALIAARHGPLDLSRVPLDDPAVFAMIQQGDTIGTFQIESRAQIQSLLRTKPTCLEDLVVQVAIVRPGPIQSGAMNPYIEGREALRRDPAWQPTYDHPSLAPILAETLGAMLYQEQVIEVAMTFAGFRAGQADQLRRAMSRKRSHEAMAQLWDQFRAGAAAKGHDLALTEHVFRKLSAFASYGFPKAHAAAFAVLAYQSSWLKCYYPVEFVCALFNNQPMGFYPPHVLVNDAKRHRVRILPPDVNQSRVRCTVEAGAVRIGLGYVKELGATPAEQIVGERDAHGAYRSLADLVRRVPLPLPAAENLVSVGAAECFGLGRREAFWQLGLFIPTRAFGGGRTKKSAGRQHALALPVAQDMVEVPPMAAWEQMSTEYDVLGLSPHYHPLGLLRPRLPGDLVSTAELTRLPDGVVVRVAGLVVCRQRPGTAKGITFLLLEDEVGLVNVIVYPDLYEEQRLLVRGEPLVVVTGRVQRRGENLNLMAQRFQRVADLDQGTAGPPAEHRPVAPAAHQYR